MNFTTVLLLLLAGVAVGYVVFTARAQGVQRIASSGVAPVRIPSSFTPGRQYKNKEIIDIVWDDESRPVRITTERDATRS